MHKLFYLIILILVVLLVVFYISNKSSWHKYQNIISIIKNQSILPNTPYQLTSSNELIQDPQGRITILTTKPILIVQIDTGGGHTGARGIIYCDDKNKTIKYLQNLLPEGIILQPEIDNYWSYRSIEE